MELESKWGKIFIQRFDSHQNTLQETSFDAVFHENCLASEFYSAFLISVPVQGLRILLCGSFYAGHDDFALVDDERLIVLVDTEIFVVDIATGRLLLHKELKVDWQSLWSIYRFGGGYIIHGEIEIVKLNNCFDTEWTFCGGDIWVTLDPAQKAFEIRGDTLRLHDWNGRYYLLNTAGQEIT
ncbi:MAG: hypothetical protein VB099_16105 [Candidatus Limiplasma sp.]|nr:hypothetical protein [Candidatus Limiplasma sp.]